MRPWGWGRDPYYRPSWRRWRPWYGLRPDWGMATLVPVVLLVVVLGLLLAPRAHPVVLFPGLRTSYLTLLLFVFVGARFVFSYLRRAVDGLLSLVLFVLLLRLVAPEFITWFGP